VKISDAACPFCEAVLGEVTERSWLAPTARMGRAAVFAFGVAVAQGCGDNLVIRAPVDSAVDAKPDALDDGGVVPIYAAAPTPDAGDAPKQG
jgi:hypothetical protein